MLETPFNGIQVAWPHVNMHLEISNNLEMRASIFFTNPATEALWGSVVAHGGWRDSNLGADANGTRREAIGFHKLPGQADWLGHIPP